MPYHEMADVLGCKNDARHEGTVASWALVSDLAGQALCETLQVGWYLRVVHAARTSGTDGARISDACHVDRKA